jgi:protein-arginine kinase activator protein McsA
MTECPLCGSEVDENGCEECGMTFDELHKIWVAGDWEE